MQGNAAPKPGEKGKQRRSAGKPRRKRELNPTLLTLTSAAVSDLAYCYYIVEHAADANGKSEAGKPGPIIKLAEECVHDFERLSKAIAPCSADEDYLFAVKRIVTSLSRGLLRRKQTFRERKDAALQEKDEHLKMLSVGNRQAAILKFSVQSLGLGIVGALLTGSLLPFVKHGEVNHQGFLSLATGLGVVLLSDYLKRWWIQFKTMRIFALYDQSINFALYEYQRSSKEEYERAREEVRAAYTMYAGHPPKELLDFGHIMDDALQMQNEWEKERKELLSWGLSLGWVRQMADRAMRSMNFMRRGKSVASAQAKTSSSTAARMQK
jgi:hypothetical protein